MIGLCLLALVGIIGLGLTIPPEEYRFSEEICLIEEDGEVWSSEHMLTFRLVVIPRGGPGWVSPIKVSQSGQNITVSTSDYPGDIYAMHIITAGRFSEMNVFWPNGDSFRRV